VVEDPIKGNTSLENPRGRRGNDPGTWGRTRVWDFKGEMFASKGGAGRGATSILIGGWRGWGGKGIRVTGPIFPEVVEAREWRRNL